MRKQLLDDLKSVVFGQDHALEQIVAEYRESKNNNTHKPKVLVAMGPTGGGKSHTATELAKSASMTTKSSRSTATSTPHTKDLWIIKSSGAAKRALRRTMERS